MCVSNVFPEPAARARDIGEREEGELLKKCGTGKEMQITGKKFGLALRAPARRQECVHLLLVSTQKHGK